MIRQRGLSFIGFVVVIILLVVAFKAGAIVQTRMNIDELDTLLADTCDTEFKRTGMWLSSSDKFYRCEFVRGMTSEEMIERERRIDEAIDGKTTRGSGTADSASAQPPARIPDPEETREK